MIKLYNLDRIWQEIRSDALDGIDQQAGQGWAQKGPAVSDLEQWLKDHSGRKYAVTLASCTDALRCSIEYLFRNSVNTPHVAVPNYTFLATANAIKKSNCIPVFIDVDEDYHIRTDKIPSWVGAVIAVDLFGLAQNYKELMKSLDNIPLIMDCAQSIETEYQGIKSVSMGWASCVSFAPTKTIPAFGSGGAVLTDDKDFADWARRWRTHGKEKNKDYSVTIGANSMISSLEAVQIMCCTKHHSKWLTRRSQIAKKYISNISGDKIIPPSVRGTHTWHKFMVKCKDAETANEFQNYMKDLNIETQKFYQTLPNMEYEKLFGYDTDTFFSNPTPNSVWLSERSVGIPCQHTLSDLEVEIISQALKEFK